MFTEGQRVTYTDKDSRVFKGSIESFKKDWVMIALDEPVATAFQGTAHRMMVRSSNLSPLEEPLSE